jgi:membrane fusion protein (multidrug efflux system)
MKKQLIIVIIGLVAVAGALGGIKALQISRMISQKKPVFPETVTTFMAREEAWESTLTSVGSLEAVQGVKVSAEISGKVVQISFNPGTMAQAGDLLLQQDIDAEKAQLRSAEATAALAKINLERTRKLLAQKTSPQSEYDNDDAQYKQAAAQADNIRALISKKTIRAPFTGMLGIRLVNLGQILSAGDEIVSLQSLDPVYVNFSLPQQNLALIRFGMTVKIETDVLPGQIIEGTITAINPQVETATRNIMVQATVANPHKLLRPGMFVNVTIVLLEKNMVLAIPATAVLNAPYSDSVFVVEDAQSDNETIPSKVARQKFVRLGVRRGDFVAVNSGLKNGETVVSTGVFKLRNGQAVVVDNTLSPEFKHEPAPKDN